MKIFLFPFLFLFTISTAINQQEFEQSVKQFFIEDKPLFDQTGFQNIKLIFKDDVTGGLADHLKKELIIGKDQNSFFRIWTVYKRYIPNEEYFYLTEPEMAFREKLKKYIPISKKARDYLIKNGFLNTDEEKKMMIDFTIMHELAHLYFKDRNKYSFHYVLTHIYKSSFSSAYLRDELYADLVAFKMMKEKYGIKFIEKLKNFRIYMGFYSIIFKQPYIHYFFKDLDVNHLPKDIKSYVDDIFLKTMKMFVPQEFFKQADITTKQIRQRYKECVALSEKEKQDCYNISSLDPNKVDEINKDNFYYEVNKILTDFRTKNQE